MRGAIAWLALAGLLAYRVPALAQGDGAASAQSAVRELHLEVFINGNSTNLIAQFYREADGTFLISARQLENVGIVPLPAATREDGRVDIARLPDLNYRYDEAGQNIYFTAAFDALSANVIDAQRRAERPRPEPEVSPGGVLNYTLYASSGGENLGGVSSYEGASAWVDARLFGGFGTLTTGFVGNTSPDWGNEITRLDTTWSYSSPNSLTTYSLGDFVSGGLTWTRPVRLGGVQIRRNFGLRPDLVTMPLPQLSGSAAVPSTVDLYIENARRLTQEVPAGPFEIVNLPAVSGRGTARVVVQDSLGRETVVEAPFFTSSRLLRQGLLDYSAEAGFPRRSFGVESNDYDRQAVASGTIRYGFNDALTLEGHAEGGTSLINAGAGAVFGLGYYGIGSLAMAGSGHEQGSGLLISGGVELDPGFIYLSARSQRTFGDYADIGAIAGRPERVLDQPLRLNSPPRAVDQLSVSLPLRFDPTTIGASYTHVDRRDGRSQLLGFTASRRLWQSTSLFANAFQDLDRSDSFGIFIGLSFPLGGRIHGSTGVNRDSRGTSYYAEASRSDQPRPGSYGWRLRNMEGATTNRLASASYRSSFARLQVGVEQYEDRYRATGQIEGSFVAAGGDVFLANRIDDAFAVVDAGAPGVPVELENRPMGETNSRGRMLLPGLRSYEANRISIDPSALPVDAIVQETRRVAVPADRSGTTVSFAVQTEVPSALVTLVAGDGSFVPVGSAGTLADSGQSFIVGYDGQAFISDLGPSNRVEVEFPSGERCHARFSFTPRPGEQVAIPAVGCHPID